LCIPAWVIDGLFDLGDKTMSIKAMKQALDALESSWVYGADTLSGPARGQPDDRKFQRDGVAEMTKRARLGKEALRQAIAEAEKQEPVAWVQDVEFEQLPEFAFSWVKTRLHDKPLYTHPPQREWVSLTDDQIKEIVGPHGGPIKGYTRALFDKIDAKLRENNG
jgi:hypothetical protein